MHFDGVKAMCFWDFPRQKIKNVLRAGPDLAYAGVEGGGGGDLAGGGPVLNGMKSCFEW